jgi:hypothetical protein
MEDVMDEDMDWLGEKLTATINRELDLIERRNGEGFTPTFERDMAFKVASLAFAAFSARGYTQGGTMIACELRDLVAGAEITTLRAEIASRDAALVAVNEDFEANAEELAKVDQARARARTDALEEAAKVADELGGSRTERGPDGLPRSYDLTCKQARGDGLLNSMRVRAHTIATAIRALATQGDGA